MDTHARLIKQREVILDQIQRLGPMRMGTVSEQFLPTRRADGSVYRRGPYLTYTFKRGRKTCGKHLRDEQQARLYRQQIDNWRRYQALSTELVEVSQRLADLEARTAEEGKKNSKNWSRPSKRPRRLG
jgi:hypothetical protein